MPENNNLDYVSIPCVEYESLVYSAAVLDTVIRVLKSDEYPDKDILMTIIGEEGATNE